MAKPSEMDLRDYGRILVRRKWWVLSSLLGALVLAFVLNTVTAPVYRATVRIQISREPSRSLLTGAEIESPSAQSDNLALFTAAELITNRKLMARAVSSLRQRGVLTGDEGTAQSWLGRLLRGVPASAGTIEASDTTGTPVSNDEVDWLLSNINVEPVRDTRLVNIHVELSNPRSAEKVANTVADLFVRYQAETHSAGSSSMVTYLTSQLQDVRANLAQSEQASAFVKARSDRVAVQARLDQLRQAQESLDLDHLTIQTPAIDALRKQLADSESELAKARQIYKDRHPRLVALETENASIRSSIRNELATVMAQVRGELVTASAAERSVAGVPATLSSRNPATLESDVANNRDLYNALLTKLKEAEISGQAHGPLVEVVEPAAAQPDPVRPRKLMNFIVCLFAGGVIGTGLAFLREYLRRTIRTPQDVDEHLQLPVLGLIPKA